MSNDEICGTTVSANVSRYISRNPWKGSDFMPGWREAYLISIVWKNSVICHWLIRDFFRLQRRYYRWKKIGISRLSILTVSS